MSLITDESIKASLESHEDLVALVSSKKYEDLDAGEHNFTQVKERMSLAFNTTIKCLPGGVSDDKDILDNMKQLLNSGRMIPAGSILSCWGTNKKSSLSNCYLTPIEGDNIEAIFEAQKMLARTFSYRGGSGTDITVLRPKGALVNNAATSSSGSVSFMPLFSEVTNVIGTNGRRAALLISEDIRHPDAMDFIWCKSKPEVVFGTDSLTGKVPDVTGANITVKITDDFMHAVEQDGDWTFKFPHIDKVTFEITDCTAKAPIEVLRALNCKTGDHMVLEDGTTYEVSWVEWEDTEIALRLVSETQYDVNAPAAPDHDLVDVTYIKFEDVGCNNKPCKNVYETLWRGDYDVWEQDLGQVCQDYHTMPAKQIFQELAESAHASGDPGVAFIDTVQRLTPGTFIDPTKLKPIGFNPCWTGDTKVWTLGGLKTFAELAEAQLDVPVLTSVKGELVYRMMRNPRKTGEKQKLCRLYLPNLEGNTLTCTPGHKMVMRDGTQRMVKDLIKGDRIYASIDCQLEPLSIPVIRVEFLEETQDVYNGTVDDTHTYFVSVGDGASILSANCGEQSISYYSNCLLTAIVLPKYVENPWTNKAHFNFDLFTKDVKNAVLFLNTASYANRNQHPLQEQRDADEYGRRIGLEVTGLADMLAMLWCGYGSEESILVIDEIMQVKAVAELEASLVLVPIFGVAPAYKTMLDFGKTMEDLLKTEYFQGLDLPTSLIGAISRSKGLANTAWNTLGPCGSISIMSGNVTSGIEPLFAFSYSRKTRLSDQTYEFIHNPAAEHINSLGLTEDHNDVKARTAAEWLKELNYIEAPDIDYVERIAIQATCQKYTDSAISSTINLHETAPASAISDIYFRSWQEKLKGITVFRDGCKQGVLEASSTFKNVAEVAEAGSDAPTTSDSYEGLIERELLDTEQAVRHCVLWQKSKLYIIVSVDENEKPLEIFTKLPRTAGVNGDGLYHEHVYQERTANWDTICRLASILLRVGMPVERIINQLDKSSYSMTDAAGIVSRVLKKHLPELEVSDEEIIENGLGDKCPSCGLFTYVHEGGCGVCKNCGETTCG